MTKTDYIQNEDGTTSQILPDSSAKTWKTDIHGNSIEENLGKKTINITYIKLGLESCSVTEADRGDQGNVINSELKTIYDAEENAAII